MDMLVNDGPTDGISHLVFGPSTNSLLVSSWDKNLRLYAVDDTGISILQWRHTYEAPYLSCCFIDDTHIAGGSSDGAVLVGDITDFSPDACSVIGKHAAGVSAVCAAGNPGVVVSGSWDGSVRFWDTRAGGSAPVTVNVGSKVFKMAARDNLLLVATADKNVLLFDARNPVAPLDTRQSTLKSQIRSIAVAPNGKSFACGSVEGRVALDYVDAADAGLRYAFKCHRQKEGEAEAVYPVNALAYHPVGTLASGGGDGFVYIWDAQNKKRITSLTPFETSIASLSFNHDGKLLAIAASYTFEEGDAKHPQDAIYIHMVSDPEVVPKAK